MTTKWVGTWVKNASFLHAISYHGVEKLLKRENSKNESPNKNGIEPTEICKTIVWWWNKSVYISYHVECNVSPFWRQKSHIFCFNSHRLFETQTWENVNAYAEERSTKEKEIRRQVFRLYASLPLNRSILFGSASLERAILDSRFGSKPKRRSFRLWKRRCLFHSAKCKM